MSYRKHLMTSDEPPSELYKAVELSTNLAEVGTDTISRRAAIEALNKLSESTYEVDYGVIDCDDAIRAIEQLPPAQPESDSGRWERHYSRPGVYADLCWHCSKCGYKTDYQYANVNHHYCPHCGRKMEREVSNE